MFSSSTDAVERGIAWLEQIIDIIIKLFEALFGSSSSSTTTTTEASGADES